MLSTLLNSILPIPTAPHPGLQPIWANEAMQRAYDIVKLFAGLEHMHPYRNGSLEGLRFERRCAADLASVFLDLQIWPGNAPQPCAGTLNLAVKSIAGLFSYLVGINGITCNCETLKLGDVTRRALILAASRLLMSMLTEASTTPRDIGVGLVHVGRDAACLSVVGQSKALQQCDEIVEDLAAIMNAALTRNSLPFGQTQISVIFPLPGRAVSAASRCRS